MRKAVRVLAWSRPRGWPSGWKRLRTPVGEMEEAAEGSSVVSDVATETTVFFWGDQEGSARRAGYAGGGEDRMLSPTFAAYSFWTRGGHIQRCSFGDWIESRDTMRLCVGAAALNVG